MIKSHPVKHQSYRYASLLFPPQSLSSFNVFFSSSSHTNYKIVHILYFHNAIFIYQELCISSSRLLPAAYSIATAANDADYFLFICRELAAAIGTSEGLAACSAQDEMLHVCDELFRAERITENQLYFLRHEVLIRSESVAVIYDNYQKNKQDVRTPHPPTPHYCKFYVISSTYIYIYIYDIIFDILHHNSIIHSLLPPFPPLLSLPLSPS